MGIRPSLSDEINGNPHNLREARTPRLLISYKKDTYN